MQSKPPGQEAAPGVKVSRVIRIHNRFLKNRFERCVREATEDLANTTGRKPTRASVPSGSGDDVTSTRLAAGLKIVTEEKKNIPKEVVYCTAPSQVSTATVEPPISSETGELGTTGLNHAGEEACFKHAGLKDPESFHGQVLTSIREPEKHVSVGGSDSNPEKSSLTRHGFGLMARQQEEAERVRIDTLNGSSRSSSSSSNRSSSNENSKREKSNVDQDGGHGVGGGSGIVDMGRAGSGRSSAEGWRKGNKRSTSPPMRSLEYLFFTGRRSGTGFDCDFTNSGDDGHNAFPNNSGYCNSGSHHPDLLKLAEDGFRLSDWNEAGAVSVSTPGVDTELPSSSVGSLHSPSWPAAASPNASEIDAQNQDGDRHSSWPQTVVLSSHLNETDIPGMSGEVAKVTGKDDLIVAPPASVGEGNTDTMTPVCRVLVVKVYTGRSWHVRSRPDSGSKNNGGIPRSHVVRDALAMGFKSVCASPAGYGERSAKGVGGGSDDWSCSNGAASRYQVKVVHE